MTVSDSFATVLDYMRDDSELVGHGAGEVVDDLSANNAVPEKMEAVPGVTVYSDACKRLDDQLNDISSHNIEVPPNRHYSEPQSSVPVLWSPHARPHHSQ